MQRIPFLNDIAGPELTPHSRGRRQAARMLARPFGALTAALLATLGMFVAPASRVSAQEATAAATGPYSSWLNELSSDYRVLQGNVFLMTNDSCPQFISIFKGCFGNNPAAPYIIPQPPIGLSYVNPIYARPLNMTGPNGRTDNIIYRLSDQEALVTIVSYPPKAAYLGYVSYVFTSGIWNYVGVTPPTSRMKSPDELRYEIFGSLGNDVNDVVVQNQLGSAPWNGAIVAYITTSNANLATALVAAAKQSGVDPKSIFIEPIGSNVITGLGPGADDMVTLMRYAIPRFPTLYDTWKTSLSQNVLVYRVTNPSILVQRYGGPSYTPHLVNTSETAFTPSLSTAMQQLATLLKNYLAAKQVLRADYRSLTPTTKVNSEGVPDAGLVGSACIQYGTDCLGDDQDTSTYAVLPLRTLGLEETAFIVGVNHNRPAIDNTRYVSVGIYDAQDQTGVASASQTNPEAVGFDSGTLDGSAEGIVIALGITIPPTYTALLDNLPNLYVAGLARNVNNPTIQPAVQYAINLQGTTLLPENAPLLITERSYIVPGTTAGGNVDEMLYPLVVAAVRDFAPPQSTSTGASQ